eukprot:TRINITY_DN4307_c0_g1_i3.p1 TRINITY_DN4307_c0_g1~~TRINITY_DN4307_c0_g1_i3.p1  ORF type:complete len:124 (-),score=33.29 TRINITY_DN4307_c0_g1_i3:93-410(-)
MKLVGKKEGGMEFHRSMRGPGLHPTADAPGKFKAWVEAVLKDWDFDNICTAHIGNKIGGAKDLLRQTLADAQPIFDALEKKNANVVLEDKGEDCAKYNVEGNECG